MHADVRFDVGQLELVEDREGAVDPADGAEHGEFFVRSFLLSREAGRSVGAEGVRLNDVLGE